jgi:hypothetical protein
MLAPATNALGCSALQLVHYSVVPAISVLQCSACYFFYTVKRLLILHFSVADATSALQCGA